MDHREIARVLEACGPEARQALDRSVRQGLLPLRVPAPKRLSQWAEENFYLSAESSYVEGAWICYPYQRPIMDCIGHDDITVIDWQKSARQGYTKIILAAIDYFIEHKRRKVIAYQPTDDDRDEFVDTEIDPMLRDVKAMRRIFPAGKLRSNGNTRRFKRFLTGVLHLRGATAAKNFRRLTGDVVLYDELDGCPRDVEKEGSVVKLGDKRLEGAIWPKSIRGTTPKTKHQSNIEDCVSGADVVFRWCVPCPSCDEMHPLWPGALRERIATHGFKWSAGEPETVRHHCPNCGAGMTQSDYLEVWQRGRMQADDGTWIDARPELESIRFIDARGEEIKPPKHIAFKTWTAISPQAAWSQLVTEYLQAAERAERGDFSEMKTFVNTTLGETWEEKGDGGDEHELEQRSKASGYVLGQVPAGCLVLTAGVDVQDNRFVVDVWGHGRGEEMWLVDHQTFEANPADERDWAKLDMYLQSRFRQQSLGGTLSVEATAIDTGGHFTHQVYNFCRQREHRRVHAIKGSSKYGGSIKGGASRQDVNWRGQVVKAGVKLWEVGTDTAKDLIYGRLKVVQPGPGYVHFASNLSREWFEQLTAEVRVLQRVSTGEVHRWVKRRARNEALDCCVYAIFAAHTLDLHRYTERMWDRLESAVQPPPDLFAEKQQAETAAAQVAITSPEAPVHARAQRPAPDSNTAFGRQW